MSVRSFLDTNVLVYTDDPREPAKQARAIALVAEHRRAGTGVVSLQVLQEYFAATTRKLGIEAVVARRKVELLAELDVVVPDVADVLGAIDLHRLHELSFWDAMVIRAAKQSGCAQVLTEDLQDGREFDGVRVVNPFGSSVEAHEKLSLYGRPRRRSMRRPKAGPRTSARKRQQRR